MAFGTNYLERKLFVIYDTVLDEFGPIFEAKTNAGALRVFKDFYSKVSVTSPSDYQLYCLGVFTPPSGIVAFDSLYAHQIDVTDVVVSVDTKVAHE